MAKKDEEVEVAEVAEFPLTLDEFLGELPASQVETKAGFRHVMQAEKINGQKLRGEWGGLLDLYLTQPTRMSWADWTANKATDKGGQ